VAVLVLVLASGQSASNPGTEQTLGQSGAPVGLEDGEASPLPPAVAAERLAVLSAAAKAECDPIEARLCHERALAVLAADAGALEQDHARALLSEACRRGFAPSCNVIGMTRPKPIVAATPQYTKAARAKGVEGMVLVRCILPIEGHPRDCRILKSLPDLDEAVLAALAVSRYEPVTFLGHPVEVSYVFVFRFTLR
jgi:TonB family protein